MLYKVYRLHICNSPVGHNDEQLKLLEKGYLSSNEKKRYYEIEKEKFLKFKEEHKELKYPYRLIEASNPAQAINNVAYMIKPYSERVKWNFYAIEVEELNHE